MNNANILCWVYRAVEDVGGKIVKESGQVLGTDFDLGLEGQATWGKSEQQSEMFTGILEFMKPVLGEQVWIIRASILPLLLCMGWFSCCGGGLVCCLSVVPVGVLGEGGSLGHWGVGGWDFPDTFWFIKVNKICEFLLHLGGER